MTKDIQFCEICCKEGDDPYYKGWIPSCCWDDSSTCKPCQICNADENIPEPLL